jgi:hypothetical protein
LRKSPTVVSFIFRLCNLLGMEVDNPSLAVGARVEVHWDNEVHVAVVKQCHVNGSYDVVYEDGGEMGTFLTHKEHKLVLLGAKGEEVAKELPPPPTEEDDGAGVPPPPPKPTKDTAEGVQVGATEGSTSIAHVKGACAEHGAKVLLLHCDRV